MNVNTFYVMNINFIQTQQIYFVIIGKIGNVELNSYFHLDDFKLYCKLYLSSSLDLVT